MNAARLTATAVLLLAWSGARGAEITTNGVGGGDWSDPATWRGKKVPGPDDDAVVRKGDLVVFDRDDSEKVTCNKLLLDPRGTLRFKTGAGKVVLSVAGGVEAYGPVSLDGTKSAKDRLELRLVGDSAEKRAFKLLKGGALLARGRPNPGKDGPNVVLDSPRVGKMKGDLMASLEAVGGTSLDLQNVAVRNVHVKVADVDNTGSKLGEKLNVTGCTFSGMGRFYCASCDTPVVCRNTFGHPDPKRREGRALMLVLCPLPELRDNVVTGGFDYGISCAHGADAGITGNVIEKCNYAIHVFSGTGQNISKNTVRDCGTAFDLAYLNLATLQENVVEGVKAVVKAVHSNAQIMDLRASKLAKDAVGVYYGNDGKQSSGALVLLNCPFTPEQVKISLRPKLASTVPVTAMNYLVVSARGAPADAEVEVRTAGRKGEAEADLGVRNSPAPLGKGLTPRPQPAGAPLTIGPLIVKSWSVDADGKVVPAPRYVVRVLAPAERPGAERRSLGSITVAPGPTWFRARPDAPIPTLEVPLK